MAEEVQTLRLRADMTAVVNYAVQQNRLPVIREIAIENLSERGESGLSLSLSSDPPIFHSLTLPAPDIPAGETVVLRNVEPSMDHAMLSALTERVTGTITFTLSRGEETAASLERPFTALAFSEWPGLSVYPELLAAFVLPNHPALAGVLAKAAELLGGWSGDPSLDSYQTKDPNRVKQQAAAIYGALQAESLVYAAPPASFEAVGQRVRLCGDVLSARTGTCLDLALLYASCLEAAGLHPLLLLQPGHCFAGVWLEEFTFPETLQDDPSLVTKRLADGVNELLVVECTCCTAGKAVSFEEACHTAARELTDRPLDLLIDVARARLSGVRPLPLSVRDAVPCVSREDAHVPSVTAAPAALSREEERAAGPEQPAGKLAQWERRLLELGLRNTLVNLRLTRSVIPILSPSLGELEDALADGGEYRIAPRPAEWELSEEALRDVEKATDVGNRAALIQSEFKSRRLRASLGEAELTRAVVNLYRAARTTLEENGANSLFLALGLLRWYETPSSRRPRYAPILLLPVELVRKSALKGYVLRLRDEEPQMNVTLLEMLGQDFGIDVPSLQPLPQDEHGVDLRAVLTAMRRAVMEQRGWDVLECAVLGIFSFSQFVMWNDLRSRSAELLRSPIVQSLVEGRLMWDAQPMEPGSRVPEDGVLLPIAADASQLFAIEAAQRGESFVLHGPPGTGKSQTITAMIANALAQGRTVLFVAEKMAALSVVQRRLDAMGIGRFCLELHSNKSRKRDVLEQLREAAEAGAPQDGTSYTEKAEQIRAVRAELDAYAHALHQSRPSGMTLYELVNGFERYRAAPDAVRFAAGDVDSLTGAALERRRVLVGRLAAAGRAVGHPHGHPLSAVGLEEYALHLSGEAPEALAAYGAALARLDQTGRPLALVLRLGAPDSFAQWERFDGIAAALEGWLSLPRAWAELEDFEAAMGGIAALSRHFHRAGELRAALLSSWREDFLAEDGAALLREWREAGEKWFLPRLLGRNKLKKRLLPLALHDVGDDALEGQFETLASLQSELAEGRACLSGLESAVRAAEAGQSGDWTRLLRMTEQASQLAASLSALTDGGAFRRAFAGRADLAPSLAAFRQSYAAVRETRGALFALLAIDEGDADAPQWLSGQRRLCGQLGEGLGSLREWTLWRRVRAQAIAEGLAPVVEAYEGGLSHEQLEDAYLRGLYHALALGVIEGDGALRTFSGPVFDETIAQFRRLDAELEQLAREEIFCRLAARVPNFQREAAQSSEVGILQRAVRSGGRGMSIRRLFEEIPNLLPRLCPCMLMSPISAAQYLDPKREPFDIVIFDEASQLPTCKAVGALARGRSAVVVGDPKQMPPTTFFTGVTTDEDAPEYEDLESILEDCLALNMPQTHLLWHYRSRHESLIAFSNSQFYENRLYTFPSVNDLESKVTLVPVEGFFDRGRTRRNPAEAKTIVAELHRRAHTPFLAGQTVGVVTFNIHQQNLIDDLLEEACRTDETLEAWAYDREEPLFIKNLENVQGDERDVILFSVGYGADETGRVSMNFGPLNREGGWRRLNVAVSRARCEMVVFSTLRPDQIDLSRTSSEGVAALRAFLEYAGGARLAGTGTREGGVQGVCASIRRALAEAGFESRAMVGHSGCRVDVGVLDPKRPGRYLLGVLLDGPFYGAAKTTRDRELAQRAVLEGLGWELHRIWTADWWDSGERELERLLKHVREAAARERDDAPAAPPAPKLAAKAEPTKPAPEKRPAPAPESRVAAYCTAALEPLSLSAEEFLLPGHAEALRDRFAQALAAEAPVSGSVLLRRVLQCCGISRGGSRIQSYAESLLEGLGARWTEEDGRRFCWLSSQDPQSYRGVREAGGREAKEIPAQEAANAAVLVLREQIGLPRADLVRETAKLFGFTRTGPVVTAMAESGIRLALEDGRIAEAPDGGLHLPD